MADEVYDLSVQRTIKGVTGTVFKCRKPTNAVTTALRAAERHADEVAKRTARDQQRLEKVERGGAYDGEVAISDPRKWEELEAEAFDARLATLIPVLTHEDGTPPELDRLREEFAFQEIALAVVHATRPTVPDWAMTTSSASV